MISAAALMAGRIGATFDAIVTGVADKGTFVRLLAPPHLVVVAGVQSPEIHELARAAARNRRDPWVGLAALEHERRAAARRLQLQRFGAPVIAAPEGALQERIFAEYERLRRRRRV